MLAPVTAAVDWLEHGRFNQLGSREARTLRGDGEAHALALPGAAELRAARRALHGPPRRGRWRLHGRGSRSGGRPLGRSRRPCLAQACGRARRALGVIQGMHGGHLVETKHTGQQHPLTAHMQMMMRQGGSSGGRCMFTQSVQSRQPKAQGASHERDLHSAAAHPRAAPVGSPRSARTRRPAAAAWQAAQQRCRWARCALLPRARAPLWPPAPWLRAPARRAAAAAAAAAAAQDARPRRRARGPGAWRAWLRLPAPPPARAQPDSGWPPAAACAAAGHCS